MNCPRKHHYIPVFYLKRWAGADGTICEFSKPWKGRAKPKRTHPSGTGYINGLYELPGASPQHAQKLETSFFSPADSMAADALECLHAGKIKNWDVRRRSAWTRFIVSLLMRNPEDLDCLDKHLATNWSSTTTELELRYRARRQPSDPSTFSEYLSVNTTAEFIKRASLGILPALIDHSGVGGYINNMQWSVVSTENASFDLLTSDRPVIMTNGLNKPDSYIVLPIGPKKIFLAVNNLSYVRRFAEAKTDTLVGDMNNTVVIFAVKYVWGYDDRQLRFVQNRMSTRSPPSLAAQIGERVASQTPPRPL